MKLKFRSFEELLDEYLENPDFAMSFLNQALADEDVGAFKLSLTNIIRARGKISSLARKSQLSRSTLYKLMEKKGSADIGTILKLLHALGFDLVVTKQTQEAKPSKFPGMIKQTQKAKTSKTSRMKLTAQPAYCKKKKKNSDT